MKRIKIVIVDEHGITRLGISKLIESTQDIEICGEANNINDAIICIEKSKPDFVITGIIFYNELCGFELIKAIKERYPHIISLIHTMLDESIYAERAIKVGAKGYIQKNDAPDKLIAAIYNALKGELILSNNIKDKIIGKLLHGASGVNTIGMDVLSNREFEVFQLIAKGFTIKEIADKLNLSKPTIETHRRNLREKLGIMSNSQLIKYAVEWRPQK